MKYYTQTWNKHRIWPPVQPTFRVCRSRPVYRTIITAHIWSDCIVDYPDGVSIKTVLSVRTPYLYSLFQRKRMLLLADQEIPVLSMSDSMLASLRQHLQEGSQWMLVVGKRICRMVLRRVLKIVKRDYELRHEWSSVRLSAWNNSIPIGRIFMKFDIDCFSKICRKKFKFQYTFLITSRSFLLRMRKFFSGKICRETQNAFYVQWMFFESCAIF